MLNYRYPGKGVGENRKRAKKQNTFYLDSYYPLLPENWAGDFHEWIKANVPQ